MYDVWRRRGYPIPAGQGHFPVRFSPCAYLEGYCSKA
ncbi:MAG: hypothetical protein JWM57_1500, partial [Phycisphaerales bacterium]|nr:hypothetical protein [Phycisphaerales bacterium]